MFSIFINTTVQVKNTKYVLECYAALFSNLKIIWGSLPRAVSAELVAFFELLCVFCIMTNGIQLNMVEL